MDRRVQIVRAAIEADYRCAWDNEKLAQLVNLSTSRLRHLFKAETGTTPAQYLKSIRMREAQKLLMTTFLSVKQIMNRVGITDESYFGHEFRKSYGLSPSKYRSSRRTAPDVD
jgi:transcriptional regulator GlxA family with amidase domain